MELYFSGYVNKVSRVKPSYSTCANVAKLFSPSMGPIFVGKAVAYRSGAHHCNPLVHLKYLAWLKKLDRDKHCSLFCPTVSDEEKVL